MERGGRGASQGGSKRGKIAPSCAQELRELRGQKLRCTLWNHSLETSRHEAPRLAQKPYALSCLTKKAIRLCLKNRGSTVDSSASGAPIQNEVPSCAHRMHSLPALTMSYSLRTNGAMRGADAADDPDAGRFRAPASADDAARLAPTRAAAASALTSSSAIAAAAATGTATGAAAAVTGTATGATTAAAAATGGADAMRASSCCTVSWSLA